MTLLFPRISKSIALATLEELRRRGDQDVAGFVRMDHPKVEFAATSARRARPADLQHLRDEVMAVVGAVPLTEQAEFDRALGQILANRLQMSRSEASHDEPWSFLTLMVFPDLLVRRYPDLHQNRALGSRRNVLRRTWLRETLIGPEGYQTDQPLNEDEYVQILERTAMVRIPGMARSLGRNLARIKMEGRADRLTRRVATRITWMTGPRELSTLTEDDIETLVKTAIAELTEAASST